ncbi:hypothetical protein WJX84_001585 [Apatococcus fuscideae]|uniref:Uncharacterized protein n=1 Tax=Apatococcus fuscideae TaxID=2026836 RepID=A0AAW1TB33_9CHLO
MASDPPQRCATGIEMSHVPAQTEDRPDPGAHLGPDDALHLPSMNAPGFIGPGRPAPIAQASQAIARLPMEVVPEVMVSEHSATSQLSEMSAAEQGGVFPSGEGLPHAVTSPVIRAARWQPPAGTHLEDPSGLLESTGRGAHQADDDLEVTYDLGPLPGHSSDMSELSQIREEPASSGGPDGDGRDRAAWGAHGPGALRDSARGGPGGRQWTSPVVQNPLFAGASSEVEVGAMDMSSTPALNEASESHRRDAPQAGRGLGLGTPQLVGNPAFTAGPELASPEQASPEPSEPAVGVPAVRAWWQQHAAKENRSPPSQDITRLQDIARPSSQHFLRGKAGTGKVSPGAPVGQMNNNSDDNDSANGTMRQLTNMPEYWVPGLPSHQLSGLEDNDMLRTAAASALQNSIAAPRSAFLP